MARNPVTHRWLILCILLLYIFSLLLHINRIPLKFEEPRRAVVALEMILSDDYAVPTINGTHYYNKPPVYNWVLIGLFKLTGSMEEWVIRLPTVLSMLAVGFLMFIFCRHYFDASTGVYAAMFWLTSADIYFHYSLLGEIDIFYTLLVSIQVMAALHYFRLGRYRLLFLISYFFMAAGVLTKGLPSIAFQALTLLSIAIAFRKWRWLWAPAHFAGAGLALAVIGGYFYWYSLQADPWPFIVNLFIESSQRTPVGNETWKTVVHLLTFPFLHLKLLLPWLFFVILLFNKARWKTFLAHPILRFLIAFCLLNALPYWISPGTRDRYLYPFIPMIMTGLAWLYRHYYYQATAGQWIKWIFAGLMIALAILPVSFGWIDALEHIRWIWVKSGLVMVMMLALVYCFFRYPKYQMLCFLTAWIMARIAFDLTVIPARERSANENKPFHLAAASIASIAQGEDVFWYAGQDTLTREFRLPRVGVQVVHIQETDWADFSMSFYYSRQSGKLLEHTSHPSDKKFILTKQACLSQLKDVEVISEYYIKERDETYVLVRKKL